MMAPEEKLDWEAYKFNGDPSAHERICKRYLKDVKRIVNRMSIYIGDGAIDKDDLLQAGVIGLINSIETYDISKEVGFIEFAFKRIRGAVYDELRNLDGFSSRSRRQQRHLEKVKEQLQNKLFRMPTEEEAADEMGISLDKYRTLQRSVQSVKSEPLTQEIEETYQGHQSHHRNKMFARAENGLSMEEKFRVVATKIEQLPERTKILLSLYYTEGLTLKEIAEVMDLTESRICQIHANAIEMLHYQLNDIEFLLSKR